LFLPEQKQEFAWRKTCHYPFKDKGILINLIAKAHRGTTHRKAAFIAFATGR
jgi:hypothetical protein